MTPAFEHLRSVRDGGGIVVIDGAMGTELEARGARMDDAAWCALANLHEPDLVRAIHEDHIRAGADVVITNTFMSGLGPMQRAGVGDRFDEGIRNALRAARDAVDRAAQRPVAIAGSVGATPWGAPESGDEVPGRAASRRRDDYACQVGLLADGGVDLIALEMVTDAGLAEPLIEAAIGSGLPVWLGLSMRVEGQDPSEYGSLPNLRPEARAIARACLRPDLDAVNVMHTDIHDVADALRMLREMWPGPLGVYPHHGLWSAPHWTLIDVPTDQLVQLARSWIGLGATMLGGCCGLRTHHIAALRSAVDTGRTGAAAGS